MATYWHNCEMHDQMDKIREETDQKRSAPEFPDNAPPMLL